jgi:repressor of nif and glnA expression
MFDQWIVDSVHDYYEGIEVSKIVVQILTEVCARRNENKTIKQIRDDLNALGYEIGKRNVRGVLSAHEEHTGNDMKLGKP